DGQPDPGDAPDGRRQPGGAADARPRTGRAAGRRTRVIPIWRRGGREPVALRRVRASAAALDRHVGRLEQLLVLLLAVHLEIVAHVDRRALGAAQQHDLHQPILVADDDVRRLGILVDLHHVALGGEVVAIALVGVLVLLALLLGQLRLLVGVVLVL